MTCSRCGNTGKRFKMEGIRVCDGQDQEERRWLHTCVQCVMEREALSTRQEAQAWIFSNAGAVTSAPSECLLSGAPGFGRRRVRPACTSLSFRAVLRAASGYGEAEP